MIFKSDRKDGGINSAVWRKSVMCAFIERSRHMKIVQKLKNCYSGVLTVFK